MCRSAISVITFPWRCAALCSDLDCGLCVSVCARLSTPRLATVAHSHASTTENRCSRVSRASGLKTVFVCVCVCVCLCLCLCVCVCVGVCGCVCAQLHLK